MNTETIISSLSALLGAALLIAMVCLSLYMLIPLALIVIVFLWVEYESKPKKQCKTNERRKYK